MTKANVLRIRNLSIEFATERGALQALRQVDLDVPAGAIIGVVGESGCGKSTMINSIMRLLASNARITTGEIHFEGSDLLDKSEQEMRQIRGDRISMVSQDPMIALNPVLSIGAQMIDIQYRSKISREKKIARSESMLRRVGIPDARERLNHYPYQFSGGMRQRIAIAMALQAEPALLIADEPTTALDATLEVQIIHLLRELQQRMGCSILFISHHLGVIAELCDFVVVMYGGEIVERGTVRDIFHRPAHPYTRKLLECDPARMPEITRVQPVIPGEVPDLANLPGGCIFAQRCHRAFDLCHRQSPSDRTLARNHVSRCHLTGQGAP